MLTRHSYLRHRLHVLDIITNPFVIVCVLAFGNRLFDSESLDRIVGNTRQSELSEKFRNLYNPDRNETLRLSRHDNCLGRRLDPFDPCFFAFFRASAPSDKATSLFVGQGVW